MTERVYCKAVDMFGVVIGSRVVNGEQELLLALPFGDCFYPYSDVEFETEDCQ